MDKITQITKYKKTRQGHLTFGFAELVLVYVFASIAIDTASMWAYLITILLFIGACINFVKFDELKSGSKKKRAHGRR